MKNRIVKVKDIASQIRGITYSKEDATSSPAEGLLPILRANNITEHGLVFDGLVYVPKSCVKDKQLIRRGDIVIAASSGSIQVVGKAAYAHSDFNGSFGAFCKVLRPDKSVDSKYFSYFFRTPFYRSTISNLAAGANINNLKNEHLDDFEIPLPPLAEQIHIAQVLDQADRLRQQDRQLLAHYDQLVQAVFMDMFGDPVRNEKGWPVHKLRTAILNIVGGTSYGGEERNLEEGELGVLKISAVTKGNFDASEFKAVSKSIINKKVIKPRRGDLLFSRANTRELVAATCIVDKDYEDLFLPDKIWRIDFDKNLCNSVFFKHLLSKPKFRNELTKTATGTSGSMLNISMEKLRSLKVPLPAIEKQNQFAEIATQVEAQKAATQQLQAQSETLFNSLLQQAFRGEL